MAEIDLRVKVNKGSLLLLIGSAILIIALFFVLPHKTPSPSPTTTQIPNQKLGHNNFTVYAPSKPPEGFIIDQNTISSTKEAFVYAYSFDKDKKLTITIQPLPEKFDPSEFNPDKEVQTRIGRAYIVDLPTRTTAAVVTDDSLVFLNAPQKIGIEDLLAFISTMRPAK